MAQSLNGAIFTAATYGSNVVTRTAKHDVASAYVGGVVKFRGVLEATGSKAAASTLATVADTTHVPSKAVSHPAVAMLTGGTVATIVAIDISTAGVVSCKTALVDDDYVDLNGVCFDAQA